MSGDTDNTSEFGLPSAFGWPIGGAIGGITGAATFGILLWLVDPTVIEAAIPSLYGIEPAGLVGWTIHLAHGAILGVVFGFVVTRGPILGTLRSTTETDALSATGGAIRIVIAGFVYGLAVWAILPILVLPAWTGIVGTQGAETFPAPAVESLLGHVLFGVVLGLVFAATVDLSDRATDDPFDEGERGPETEAEPSGSRSK